MSVLSFPRIYFSGYMAWDPATANNNDYLPVSDGPNASLDWGYLSGMGVTGPLGPTGPAGGTGPFPPAFRSWVLGGEPDPCPAYNPPTADTSSDCGPAGASGPQYDICHMASRWNYYGGNGCWFVDYPAGGKRTLTTGGDLAYGQPVTDDPVINQPVVITGNTIGGRQSPARLVDIHPYSAWSSQIIFGGVRVGDDQTFISGRQHMRMHSRLFMVPKNVTLMIAGVMGVVFQTTFPLDQLDSSAGNSQLLQALLSAMKQPGAQGLMLRFTAFSTLYYQNGVFNDVKQRPTTADELEKLYRQGYVFPNPAYSTVVGAFGVWNRGELSTAPGGHLLVPVGAPAPLAASQASHIRHVELQHVAGHGEIKLTETLKPNPNAPAGLSGIEATFAAGAVGATPSPPPALPLGQVLAEIDSASGVVSLDLSNAIPDVGATGPKYDYGPITVGVQFGPPGASGNFGPTGASGNFMPIGSFDNYDWDSYIGRGGIVDVGFQGVTGAQVQGWLQGGGVLALQIQNQIASVEQPLSAETDSRGVYLDECQTAQVTVQVRYRNGTPPVGTKILLAQYYGWGLKTAVSQWQLVGTTGPAGPTGACNASPTGPYLNFIGATNNIVPVTVPQLNGATAPYGEATVTLGYGQPGFPVVAFYPFVGATAPTPQTSVGFGATAPNAYSIGSAHYCTVRTMPADNGLLQEFVDCWNGAGSYAGSPPYNRLQTWNFIYNNILYVYDALYPVMDQHMPLGSLESVEAAVDQLMTMISEEWVAQSTLYMPVTRELSAAKRLILLTWGDLVNRKYPQQPLSPLSVPCDE
jgi:hypothetical protein